MKLLFDAYVQYKLVGIVVLGLLDIIALLDLTLGDPFCVESCSEYCTPMKVTCQIKIWPQDQSEASSHGPLDKAWMGHLKHFSKIVFFLDISTFN
jgi:hypothetical protein